MKYAIRGTPTFMLKTTEDERIILCDSLVMKIPDDVFVAMEKLKNLKEHKNDTQQVYVGKLGEQDIVILPVQETPILRTFIISFREEALVAGLEGKIKGR